MDKDYKNIIYKAGKKVQSFFATSRGKEVTGGIITSLIGFVLNAVVQTKSNSSIKEILNEMSKTIPDGNVEQIEKVMEAFFSPWSLNSLIYTFLWFFVGVVIVDLFSSSNCHNEIMEEDSNRENFIVKLLNHLIEQVYNRCSNCTDNCGQCKKFASGDDGLIRRYLYEESKHLKQAIRKSEEGEYTLDNNIPEFHTFAITHMLQTHGDQYSVIQWIGSDSYTDQDKYDETYDSLDIDFLYTLLQKVTEPIYGRNNDKPYHMSKRSETITFKIKWLLIGNLDCMKNNFDYIFYVINQLSKVNKIARDEEMNIISRFFEFYIISEDNYKRQIEIILRSYSSESRKRLFHPENKPSFGIFGDQFMFVDALNRASHGSIYTRKYAPDGDEQSLLDATIEIYNKILSMSESLKVSELFEIYDDILDKDKGWEKHLETIWNKKSGGF